MGWAGHCVHRESIRSTTWFGILGTNHALGNFRGQCFWAGDLQFTSIYINLHQFTMMQWHLPHVFVLGQPFSKPMIHWSSHRAPTPHPKGLGHQTASEKTLLRRAWMHGCQGMSRDVWWCKPCSAEFCNQ